MTKDQIYAVELQRVRIMLFGAELLGPDDWALLDKLEPAWLELVNADAERRGLPPLGPSVRPSGNTPKTAAVGRRMTVPTSANTIVTATASGIEVIRRTCPLHADGVLRHTIVVACQHGSERGPALGLLAIGAYDLVERAQLGCVTVIRCANPYGFAIGRRQDAEWQDPNRAWSLDPAQLRGAQAEIWGAVWDGEAVYGDGEVERVVLDLHSSTEPALARTVCYPAGSAASLEWAGSAAVHLGNTAHRSQLDRRWMSMTMADAAEAVRATAPSVTTAGSLGEFAGRHANVSLTVEFPSRSYDVHASTLGPLERSIGGARIVVPYPGEGRQSERDLTLNEATAGVAGIVRWALEKHNR